MNQPIETEGTNAPSDSPKTRRVRYRYRTAAMVAIVLVAVLASAVSAYSTSSTMMTAPQQGHAANMQNLNVTASQTLGGSVTVSIGSSSQSQQMQSVTTTSVDPDNCGMYGCYPYPSYQYPPYPPYTPGYPSYPGYPAYSNAYASCTYTTPNNNAVQCYGYVYQAPNGCVELVVAAANAPYYGGTALQYYTLHNLSSTPPTGTWVRVQGQMYQGYNTSPTGAGCPGNYINVSSVTTL